MKIMRKIIVCVAMCCCSQIFAQNASDIFDDSGWLLASGFPIIQNMSIDYAGQHPLPFSPVKENNYVPFSVFDSEFESAVEAEIPSEWRERLHGAVYQRYIANAVSAWEDAMDAQLNQAAIAAGKTNPATCTNVRVGTIFSVFYNAYNHAIWVAKLQNKTITTAEALAAGYEAIKKAFPCFGSGGGGLAYAGQPEDWPEIWSWFIRNALWT